MEKYKLNIKHFFFRKILPIVISVFLFLIGLIIGLNLRNPSQNFLNSEYRLSENYKFTNPLLDCEIGQDVGKVKYNLSIQKIEKIINKKIYNNEIEYAAVYFRDLNNGPWYGINEKELFIPASLLKLPVMVGFLKQYESNLIDLNKEIIYKEAIALNIVQNFVPEKQLIPGQKYTLLDLITRMIIYSDNQSADLLKKYITRDVLNQTIKNLNIQNSEENNPNNLISVKSYSTIFRVLYNSSYLNRDNSEKALKILSEVTFNRGITQGIPPNITVSHKLGEREVGGQTKQLHDCGIVYIPKHPYILCVMTKGQNWDNLSKTIGEISKEVYEDINKSN